MVESTVQSIELILSLVYSSVYRVVSMIESTV